MKLDQKQFSFPALFPLIQHHHFVMFYSSRSISWCLSACLVESCSSYDAEGISMTKRYETFPVRPEAEDLSRDLAHYQDNRIRPCSSEILQPVQRGLLSKDYLSWRFTQQRSRSDSYRNRGQIRFHVFKDTACRPGPAPCAAAKSTNKKTLDNLHNPFERLMRC